MVFEVCSETVVKAHFFRCVAWLFFFPHREGSSDLRKLNAAGGGCGGAQGVLKSGGGSPLWCVTWLAR